MPALIYYRQKNYGIHKIYNNYIGHIKNNVTYNFLKKDYVKYIGHIKNNVFKNKIIYIVYYIMPLNTGWKTWDKYLNQFAGKKITVIELGVYLGDSTFWFLNNLLTHKESKIYSIDTFQGSPEYGIDFNIIKNKFFNKLAEQPDKSKVNVIETYSHIGLRKLIDMKIKADVIYIDASHVASDVITDAVLSFVLIKTDGIIIFDDYLWDKIKPDFFTPKPAIDAFLYIYKPYIELLHKARQVFIKKLDNTRQIKPFVEVSQKLTDICDLYMDIFIYRTEILTITTLTKANYNLTISNLPDRHSSIINTINVDCIPLDTFSHKMNESIIKIKDSPININTYIYFLEVQKLYTPDMNHIDYFHYSINNLDKTADISPLFNNKYPNIKFTYKYTNILNEDIYKDPYILRQYYDKYNIVWINLVITNIIDYSKELINSAMTILNVLYGILICKMNGNICVKFVDISYDISIQIIQLMKAHFNIIKICMSPPTCNDKECNISFNIYGYKLQQKNIKIIEKMIEKISKEIKITSPKYDNSITKYIDNIIIIDPDFIKIVKSADYTFYKKTFINLINSVCKYKKNDLFFEIYKMRILSKLK